MGRVAVSLLVAALLASCAAPEALHGVGSRVGMATRTSAERVYPWTVPAGSALYLSVLEMPWPGASQPSDRPTLDALVRAAASDALAATFRVAGGATGEPLSEALAKASALRCDYLLRIRHMDLARTRDDGRRTRRVRLVFDLYDVNSGARIDSVKARAAQATLAPYGAPLERLLAQALADYTARLVP